MNRLTVWIVLFIALVTVVSGEIRSDKAMFEKAKLLIFDKNWGAALILLDEAVREYPGSPFYSTMVFYRGKCLEELQEKKQALETYAQYIKFGDNESLKEEAQISLIDLSIDFFNRGEKKGIDRVIDFLDDSNKTLKYYAAIQLSYLEDKKQATVALPVLQKIVEAEPDPQLKDRAKIAILRIDPLALRHADLDADSPAGGTLKIRIYETGKRDPSVTLNVPMALADLALRALGDEAKTALRKKGYDVGRILRQVSEKKGFALELNAEDVRIKIWIE